MPQEAQPAKMQKEDLSSVQVLESGQPVSGQSRNWGWSKDKPKLGRSTIELLENYSKIPRDRIETHVEEIRQRGWSLYPYPCIGSWRFLELSVGKSPQYPEILDRIKHGGEKYLDLGCCFGQDIRRLTADGAPSHLLHGFDLKDGFFDLGYDLFRDRQTLKSKFVAGDLFEMPIVDLPLDHPSGLEIPAHTAVQHPLLELKDQISIIHASSFYHLFSWTDQVRAALCTLQLMNRQPGSIIFGRQSGGWALTPISEDQRTSETPPSGKKVHGSTDSVRRIAGEMTRLGRTVYRHDGSTWERFWKEIGQKTSTKWDVWAEETVEEAESMERLKDIGVEDQVPKGWELRRVWMRYCCRLVAC